MKNPFQDVDVEHALGLLGLWLALLLARLANRGYGEQATYADRISGFLARRGIDGIAVIGWLVDRLPQSAHSREVVRFLQPTAVRTSIMKILVAVVFTIALCAPAQAAERIARPSVPSKIEVDPGFEPFLVGHAIGTQNYICVATAGGGIDWLPIGPQATVFDAAFIQVMTHFQSKNPLQDDAIQATWMSKDTSAAWAVKLRGSTDAAYVAPDAIEWLLLEVTGTQVGPTGGSKLSPAVFIQRVNTVGGLKPSAADCTIVNMTRKLVSYEADYYFYR